MEETLALVIMRALVFLVAIYLLMNMLYLARKGKGGVFSRALSALLLAVTLFLLVESMQFLGILSGESFELFRLVAMLIFLIMLLYAVELLKRDMLAYDHIMQRRVKRRAGFLE